MRGAERAARPEPGRHPNYFFFAGRRRSFLFGARGGLLLGARSGFLGAFAPWRAFSAPLAGALLGALGAGAAPSSPSSFFSLIISTSPGTASAAAASLGRFLFLRARRGDGDDRNVLVTEDFGALGRLDVAHVNGLANLEVADVHGDDLRQILGQGAHPDLEQHVLQHTAVGLDALGFADGLDRHHDGHLLVLGHFVEIHVQHLTGEGMVLDFLHQCQPLGPGVVLDRQVHQQVFGDRMVDEVFHFLGVDFEVLRRRPAGRR